MEKDYLYRWNFEESKLEKFTGLWRSEYDDVYDCFSVWFEPDEAMNYHGIICLEPGSGFEHVYNGILVLPREDDERALDIFKKEFRLDMAEAKMTFEKLEKALAVLENIGS